MPKALAKKVAKKAIEEVADRVERTLLSNRTAALYMIEAEGTPDLPVGAKVVHDGNCFHLETTLTWNSKTKLWKPKQ